MNGNKLLIKDVPLTYDNPSNIVLLLSHDDWEFLLSLSGSDLLTISKELSKYIQELRKIRHGKN